ncbi:uncharacterized protein LOC118732671, partial [Rhagoletis pomonella]|uniref:uncharacterized protein LOC118732671 n=1 Tax=Rhagoletis pomonella TaxID=28610 RepID=UPI001785C4F7
MTKGIDDTQFQEFNKFHIASISRCDAVFKEKRKTQNKKLEKLLSTRTTTTYTPSVKPVSDLVVNMSKEIFGADELELLNRGLNFTVKPKKEPIIDIIADIESSIQYKTPDVKKSIRDAALPLIKSSQQQKHKHKNKWLNTLNKLQQKDVFYMKSDKGNKVVIMDKQEYDKRMKESIQEDNFSVSSKSPLNAMKKDAKVATDSICQAFGVNKYHLIVSNPSVPLMYGLPKVHKNGSKMRKIVSNINSPLSNIARWLVKDLKKFGSFDGYSVKNSLDFIEKVRDIEIEKDEIMISFDVEALFPSIPVDTAIEAIQNHLNKFSLPEDKFNAYLNAIKICMKHNCFQFRGVYYNNNFGCSMGNSLSPYVAEAFMCNFESQLKSEGVLPRIWLRYVDDTFAIVKISDIDKILGTLNSRYP